MSHPSFKFLNDLNYGKQNILNDENEKEYDPYFVLMMLSNNLDNINITNEINKRLSMPKKMQYLYLLNKVRKKRRYNPYPKATENPRSEDIQYLSAYYKCSSRVAEGYLDIHTKEQMDYIKKVCPIDISK